MMCKQQIAYKLKFGFTTIMCKSVRNKFTSYIYNFAKLVDWTESKSDPELKVCILGDSNLYKQLVKRYAGKKIGNQTVQVKLILEENDFDGIHILFVSRKKKDLIDLIAKKLIGKNTLLISENDGSLDKGAVINFITVNNNLKFEINETNATSHNLIIGSTLKSLAKK